MDGAQWLERVFEPALRSDDPAVYPQLLGALRALSDCGVLSEEIVEHARGRLHARFEWLAVPAVDAPDPTVRGSHPRLEAVLAPARALADADGVTVLLVSVEAWTDELRLRLAAQRSALTDELDVEYQAAMAHWVTLADESQASGVKVPAPHPPAERLTRLPLSLNDDVGTVYEAGDRQSGGYGSEWRAEWQFTPGVPPEATRLTVAVGTGGGRQALELALPPRS